MGGSLMVSVKILEVFTQVVVVTSLYTSRTVLFPHR